MDHADTTKGWCCDGRTWQEHASADGDCCQSEGTQIDQLPPEGKQLAQQRVSESSSPQG